MVDIRRDRQAWTEMSALFSVYYNEAKVKEKGGTCEGRVKYWTQKKLETERQLTSESMMGGNTVLSPLIRPPLVMLAEGGGGGVCEGSDVKINGKN